MTMAHGHRASIHPALQSACDGILKLANDLESLCKQRTQALEQSAEECRLMLSWMEKERNLRHNDFLEALRKKTAPSSEKKPKSSASEAELALRQKEAEKEEEEKNKNALDRALEKAQKVRQANAMLVQHQNPSAAPKSSSQSSQPLSSSTSRSKPSPMASKEDPAAKRRSLSASTGKRVGSASSSSASASKPAPSIPSKPAAPINLASSSSSIPPKPEKKEETPPGPQEEQKQKDEEQEQKMMEKERTELNEFYSRFIEWRKIASEYDSMKKQAPTRDDIVRSFEWLHSRYISHSNDAHDSQPSSSNDMLRTVHADAIITQSSGLLDVLDSLGEIPQNVDEDVMHRMAALRLDAHAEHESEEAAELRALFPMWYTLNRVESEMQLLEKKAALFVQQSADSGAADKHWEKVNAFFDDSVDEEDDEEEKQEEKEMCWPDCWLPAELMEEEVASLLFMGKDDDSEEDKEKKQQSVVIHYTRKRELLEMYTVRFELQQMQLTRRIREQVAAELLPLLQRMSSAPPEDRTPEEERDFLIAWRLAYSVLCHDGRRLVPVIRRVEQQAEEPVVDE